MIVLDSSKVSRGGGAGHGVAIFGLGLVGTGVATWLRSRSGAQAKYLPFDWRPAANRVAQIAQIKRELLSICDKGEPDVGKLSIVWAAGAAGFSAKQDTLNDEKCSLGLILDMCASLQATRPDTNVAFHLVSSAGGLFEGQRDVTALSSPKPLRPYAVSKLEQEEMVKSLPLSITRRIYRPSSIYGYKHGGRPGLIVTLVRNSYQRKTTRITGSLDTLRDYIHVSDVARFIGEQVLEPGHSGGTYLLACGKPATMRSVIGQVQQLVGHPLYLQFDPAPANAEHNTYRPAALRHLGNTMSLAYGLKLTASEWFSQEFGRATG